MRTICIKTKIKNEHLNDVKLWFKTLLARREEVFETLNKEKVLVESAFLDIQGKETYLIYYLKAENIEKAYEIFDNSNTSIDLYFKECWKKYCEGRTVLEELLDLDNF